MEFWNLNLRLFCQNNFCHTNWFPNIRQWWQFCLSHKADTKQGSLHQEKETFEELLYNTKTTCDLSIHRTIYIVINIYWCIFPIKEYYSISDRISNRKKWLKHHFKPLLSIYVETVNQIMHISSLWWQKPYGFLPFYSIFATMFV